MKYFKFTQISAESGISWMIEQPRSGPSLPHTILPGLTNITQLAHDSAYYIGEVDDNAQANPANYMFEITAQERAEELQKHIETLRQQRLDRIYQEEKEFRENIFSKYDESASVAGVYKYEEAKALVADNTSPAVTIRQEATLRGLDPIVLAQRIITNHEDFRTKEAKIAGIRGLIFDRLTNFTFDINNPDSSVSEFFSEEKIGERIENQYINGELTPITVDVMVGKYDHAIALRYSTLG